VTKLTYRSNNLLYPKVRYHLQLREPYVSSDWELTHPP